MIGKFAEATGGLLQIVLTCENDEERLLMDIFAKEHNHKKNKLWIHGFCYSYHSRSMNFGHIKEKTLKKHTKGKKND